MTNNSNSVVRPELVVCGSQSFGWGELVGAAAEFLTASTLRHHHEALLTEGAYAPTMLETLAGLVEWEVREGCTSDYLGESFWVSEFVSGELVGVLARDAMNLMMTVDGVAHLEREYREFSALPEYDEV